MKVFNQTYMNMKIKVHNEIAKKYEPGLLLSKICQAHFLKPVHRYSLALVTETWCFRLGSGTSGNKSRIAVFL